MYSFTYQLFTCLYEYTGAYSLALCIFQQYLSYFMFTFFSPDMLYFWGTVFVTSLGYREISCCSTYGSWKEMTLEQVLYDSQNVVYGRDIRRYDVDDTAGYVRTDSTFEVFCTFKHHGPIRQNITIHRISPRDCSGTDFAIGDEVILAIKRTGNGNFEWHEVNAPQSAAFPASKSNLERVTKICGLSIVKEPYGRPPNSTPKCPRSRPNHYYCTTGQGVRHHHSILLVPAVVFSLLSPLFK